MFSGVDDVIKRFENENYICDSRIATVVYLSQQMQKPVLVEGPAGVGKTELGKVIARSLGLEFIRLQCYEGLDESRSLYEWEYSKQLLYTQILRDVISRELEGAGSLAEALETVSKQDSVFFSKKFILPRPLLKAVLSEKASVLLIDEIDKSDPEFEAFLLELLSDFQVSIPELGTIKANHIPLVILTSNNEREMSDALKRRCLHLYIDFPSKELEMRILEIKVPDIENNMTKSIVSAVNRIRALDLKKLPGISETLDWARALILLNSKKLDRETALSTLNVLLKYEKDIKKTEEHMGYLLED